MYTVYLIETTKENSNYPYSSEIWLFEYETKHNTHVYLARTKYPSSFEKQLDNDLTVISYSRS